MKMSVNSEAEQAELKKSVDLPEQEVGGLERQTVECGLYHSHLSLYDFMRDDFCNRYNSLFVAEFIFSLSNFASSIPVSL